MLALFDMVLGATVAIGLFGWVAAVLKLVVAGLKDALQNDD